MKVELEIITDRLPTEADGNEHGFVLECDNGTWLGTPWHLVRGPWMRQPPPPPKPPIDTSLAASIERLERVAKTLTSNDPDGVGEGWRKLRTEERVMHGDEARYIGWKNWWKINGNDVSIVQLNGVEYRRRIEAEL